MAKRKAATRAAGKAKSTKKAKKRAAAKSSRRTARAGRKTARRGTARKAARGSAKKAAKRTAARKASARRKAPASRKSAPKRAATRKAAAKAKAPARKAPRKTARRAALPAGGRKAPALDRARRTIVDEEITETPPSSLDLDRTASAARTGRREMKERYDLHTETSPAMTAGDVDADWESAYSVGDEAPGGDNPTPDQDIVDEIGRAVGVQYDDNEELKGEKKISDRDRQRWELDPASAEDYNEHDQD